MFFFCNLFKLLEQISLEMGKRCDFTNVFPTVVVTSFANRLKYWPGNFPSWKFPLLPSALNQCRQTAKAKVNCNYGVGGWPPSSSGSARRSRGTKISPRKFPTKPCRVRPLLNVLAAARDARVLVVLFQCYLGNDGARFVCCERFNNALKREICVLRRNCASFLWCRSSKRNILLQLWISIKNVFCLARVIERECKYCANS